MTWVGDRLEVLAACLCEQLAEADAETCFCGVIPGQAVPMDLMNRCDESSAECGMAYVRLAGAYPSSVIGVPDQNPGNCGTGIGFDVEIGIYRCFPLADDGGPPPAEEMDAAFRAQMVDLAVMRETVICCTWLDGKDFVLGNYQPYGPEGGIIGGTFSLFATVYGPGVLG